MKKRFLLFLMIAVSFSSFAFTGFAAEDSTWEIRTDKESYEAGEYIKVDIWNTQELANDFQVGMIHFTFHSDLIEYAVRDDAFKAAFPGTSVSTVRIVGIAGGANDAEGDFAVGLAAGDPVIVGANQPVYTLFLKAKEDVVGTHLLRFQWVMSGEDRPSYAAFWDAENVSHNYSMAFVDKTVTLTGGAGEEPMILNPTNPFAPAVNPSLSNPFSILAGREEKEITGPYGVVFSKVLPKNSTIMETSGFLFSENSLSEEEFKFEYLITENILDCPAENFTSKNEFGVLFHGAGIQPGKTYYVRAYVKYQDSSILYAPATSFTVAE